MPIELGTIRGFKTRFHLYTVPGQVFYEASRKLILKGVDGVVFVADSQEVRHDANMDSIENLKQNLKDHGYDPLSIPYVLQFNKRDLPMVLTNEQLKKDLVFRGEPSYDAVATDGTGVFETLKGIIKQVLLDLKR